MADGKWINDLTEATPVADAARRVLAVRLEVVRDALPLARKALKDADPSLRCLAAQAVWRIEGGGKNAVPVLLDALKDQEDHVRAEATFNFGLMGNDAKGAADALRAALKDPYVKVRRDAAYALVQMDPKDRESAAAFVKALRQAGLPSAFAVSRVAMLRTLGGLAADDEEAAAVLRDLLAGEPHRYWAALDAVLKKIDAGQ